MVDGSEHRSHRTKDDQSPDGHEKIVANGTDGGTIIQSRPGNRFSAAVGAIVASGSTTTSKL